MNLRHLQIITPLVAVAIARRPGRRKECLYLKEIADKAGMSRQRAAWIFHQDNWERVPLGEVVRFLRGCGIELNELSRHVRYIRRTMESQDPLAHIELQRSGVLHTITKRLR